MRILFGAGHVLGAKIYLGYNEDLSMFDLAKREAQYAKDRYGQETKVFSVTGTSYPAVEDACRGCDIAIFEHSNAEPAPVKGTANRVTIYRTVKNQGDGVCADIAKVTATILNTIAYPVQHAKNSTGNDAYGVLGRAMLAGCQDAWLAENGFHTHTETRRLLSSAQIRQQIAEAKVDAMASYYGWESENLKQGDKGADVKLWQNRLIQWNANALPRFKADGSFGGETVTWTNKFKAATGLPADGVVDDLTWDAMIDALKPSGPSQAELAAAKAQISDLTDQIVAAKAAQMAAEQYATSRDGEVQRLAGKIDAFKRGLDAVSTP